MKKYVLGRAKTLALLDYLKGSAGNTDLTLYLPPHPAPDELENLLHNLKSSPTTAGELGKIITTSPHGAAVFRAEGQLRLVIPPFPLKEKVLFQSIETMPLRTMLQQEYTIGVVLVRLGSYGISLCRGEKLVSSKVGTGLIHGRHRQGGSSSHRFERHRDKQIEQFLIRVGERIREQFEPYEKTIDFLVFGGARTTIIICKKYCPWLERIARPELPPLLDIPEPRLPVLKEAVSRIWSSTVYEWPGG
ncbi:MAG: Vms1/Ankzf1 family peptidyl-tRNA hydrolase [Dehalococcoidales bacterium]|jgi:hypothetical protein